MTKQQTIKNRYGRTIFDGHFNTIKEAIETAIHQKKDLSYADLRHKNLSNITMDDAYMPHSDLTGSNLTGANMSEANLEHSIFDEADMYNTCLAYSQLNACSFINTNFGGTDITGSDLIHARFSGLSCFDLNFINASTIDHCHYIHPDQKVQTFSEAPIVIKGYNKPIIIMDTPAIQKLKDSVDGSKIFNFN